MNYASTGSTDPNAGPSNAKERIKTWIDTILICILEPQNAREQAVCQQEPECGGRSSQRSSDDVVEDYHHR